MSPAKAAPAQVRPDTPVVLVKGPDEVLVNEAVLRAQSTLVGEDDPTLVLDVVGPERLAADSGEATLGPLLDAIRTMPFLTDRRVVVGRGLGGFRTKDQVAPLVDELARLSPSTAVILVWERAGTSDRKSAVPSSLTKAVAAAGGVVVDTDPGRKVGEWARAQLAQAPITLDPTATDTVVDAVGEDAARLGAIVSALVGAHGEGARLGPAEVEPYLPTEAGGVPPWDLTDPIDRGDVPAALAALDRMVHGGGRHPLQVLALLTGHFQKMVALDGAGVADEKAAAALVGGAPFQAKKAMAQSRRLGHDRLVELVGLLAAADLDLKGRAAVGWEGGDEAVLEVLVARLASRSRR